MVELASAEAARRGYRNVTVEVGDAQELENESFDVILSSLVIFFLPDPRAALRAWRAALRPGGRLGWLRWSWSHGMRALWERIPEGNRHAVEAKAVAELVRMADEPEGLTLPMVARYTTATAG